MSKEYDEKEAYLYLNFNGALTTENIEKPNTFLRVADLHTPNPLVQVDDLLYKGSYEDCLGTNLFFTEDETAKHTSCFRKSHPISLKYSLLQSKVLSLRNVRIESSADVEETNQEFNVSMDKDYTNTLAKLADGTLNLEDLLVKEKSKLIVEKITNKKSQTEKQEETVTTAGHDETAETTPKEPLCETMVLEEQLENIPIENPPAESRLLKKYEKLQALARRPVHRISEPEAIQRCEEKYKKAYEYHNIERQILQKSDSFPGLDFDIDEKTLANAVDIDRCILYEIIPESDRCNSVLSEATKNKLLKLDNFDNMSLPARYFVLRRELQQLQECVKSSSEKQLEKDDEFGRTPLDTLSIFQKLVANIENYFCAVKEGLNACDNKGRKCEDINSKINDDNNEMEVDKDK